MKLNLDLKKLVAMLLAIITVSVISTILLGKSVHTEDFDTSVADENTEIFVITQQDLDVLKVDRKYDFGLPLQGGPRRDWMDRVAMEADSAKTGLAEQGLPASIEGTEETEEVDSRSIQHGFNALLSDKISVNRSVLDTRPFQCYSRKYLANLPNVSVIMVFHNPQLSVLLRAIHSIINRTPHELLHEIILVDDGSTDPELKQELDEYVNQHMPKKVSIKRQLGHTGVPAARVAGVKSATGSIIVFCDALIEVIYNWLPPLIEPIAIHYKIVTSPILDKIDNMNFGIRRSDSRLLRGGFNWFFAYSQLPVLPVDNKAESQPYRNPVMEGTVFAMSRKYFLELGGHDEGLLAGGGEQYEMSFKIWMCGGMLLQVPCSRVAHIFMPHKEPPNALERQLATRQEPDNLTRNYKRVAEVWMDGYKHYLYSRDPNRYQFGAGNVTHQHEIRERLECKNFHWYMHEVAPDFLERFPLVESHGYASGAIQSMAFPDFCVDALAAGPRMPVGMRECSANRTHPQPSQFWKFTRELEIVCVSNYNCLQVRGVAPNATVWLQHCHKGDNQAWYYSSQSKWIQQSSSLNRCLEAFMDGGKAFLRVNHCFTDSKSQHWQIGWTNRFMDTLYRTNSTNQKRKLLDFLI